MKKHVLWWVWAFALILLAYFNLLWSTAAAIGTVFYLLVDKSESKERLWCVCGGHYIGNEPYTFTEGEEDESVPLCLRCSQRTEKELERILRESDEVLKRCDERVEANRREWEALPQSEKRKRLEENLKTWATKGSDGIWRRNDDESVIELGDDGTVVRVLSRDGV